MEAEEPAVHKSLGPSLIKGLASCNNSIRSKSLKSLFNYLSSQTLISDDEFKKLWKALFYCMWHCDKIQNQTQLVNRLSHLLTTLPYPISLSYFSHFLATMRREWPGIDHLRLDKFYLLVRDFVRNLFVLMKKLNWDLCVLEEFVRVLEKNVLLYVDDDVKGDNGLGNGVSYHVVSVFCDEIKPFLPLSLGVLNLLFRPFLGVLCKSGNKVLVGKVKGNVFDCLLKNGKEFLEVKKRGGECEVDEKGDVVVFGTVALAMGVGARFLELGSSEECVQGNRKVVFGLHEEFSKLEKERDGLGFEVSLPEHDDEVPRLIPIDDQGGNAREANGGMKVEAGNEKDKDSKKGSKEKKSKKKKKKKNKDKGEGSNSDGNSDNGSGYDTEMANASDSSSGVEFNETMISNLQQQFEKIAAESGLDGDGASALESPTTVEIKDKSAKKRKRIKPEAIADTSVQNDVEEEEEVVPNTESKSVKRVRFAMKNNIVWKPQTPLPPQNVRIPPSLTPRGSALKKGLSPGPIRDVSFEVKKQKKKKPSPLKKAKKVKSVSPSKRVKKMKVKPMSA